MEILARIQIEMREGWKKYIADGGTNVTNADRVNPPNIPGTTNPHMKLMVKAQLIDGVWHVTTNANGVADMLQAIRNNMKTRHQVGSDGSFSIKMESGEIQKVKIVNADFTPQEVVDYLAFTEPLEPIQSSIKNQLGYINEIEIKIKNAENLRSTNSNLDKHSLQKIADATGYNVDDLIKNPEIREQSIKKYINALAKKKAELSVQLQALQSREVQTQAKKNNVSIPDEKLQMLRDLEAMVGRQNLSDLYTKWVCAERATLDQHTRVNRGFVFDMVTGFLTDEVTGELIKPGERLAFGKPFEMMINGKKEILFFAKPCDRCSTVFRTAPFEKSDGTSALRIEALTPEEESVVKNALSKKELKALSPEANAGMRAKLERMNMLKNTAGMSAFPPLIFLSGKIVGHLTGLETFGELATGGVAVGLSYAETGAGAATRILLATIAIDAAGNLISETWSYEAGIWTKLLGNAALAGRLLGSSGAGAGAALGVGILELLVEIDKYYKAVSAGESIRYRESITCADMVQRFSGVPYAKIIYEGDLNSFERALPNQFTRNASRLLPGSGCGRLTCSTVPGTCSKMLPALGFSVLYGQDQDNSCEVIDEYFAWKERVVSSGHLPYYYGFYPEFGNNAYNLCRTLLSAVSYENLQKTIPERARQEAYRAAEVSRIQRMLADDYGGKHVKLVLSQFMKIEIEEGLAKSWLSGGAQEFDPLIKKIDQINRAIVSYIGRPLKLDDLRTWSDKLKLVDVLPPQIDREVRESVEAKNKISEAIKSSYRLYLRRDAAPSEVLHWLNEYLLRGITLEGIAQEISESLEARVKRIWLTYTGQYPSQNEINSIRGQSNEEITAIALSSQTRKDAVKNAFLKVYGYTDQDIAQYLNETVYSAKDPIADMLIKLSSSCLRRYIDAYYRLREDFPSLEQIKKFMADRDSSYCQAGINFHTLSDNQYSPPRLANGEVAYTNDIPEIYKNKIKAAYKTYLNRDAQNDSWFAEYLRHSNFQEIIRLIEMSPEAIILRDNRRKEAILRLLEEVPTISESCRIAVAQSYSYGMNILIDDLAKMAQSCQDYQDSRNICKLPKDPVMDDLVCPLEQDPSNSDTLDPFDFKVIPRITTNPLPTSIPPVTTTPTITWSPLTTTSIQSDSATNTVPSVSTSMQNFVAPIINISNPLTQPTSVSPSIPPSAAPTPTSSTSYAPIHGDSKEEPAIEKEILLDDPQSQGLTLPSIPPSTSLTPTSSTSYAPIHGDSTEEPTVEKETLLDDP